MAHSVIFEANDTFFNLSGDLGKELKNLITLMDQDDDDSPPHGINSMRRTGNKESPV